MPNIISSLLPFIPPLQFNFSLLLILPSGSPKTNLWAFHSHDFLQRIPGGSKRAGQEHPGRGALLHCGPQPREYPESLSRQTMKDQGAGGDCPDEEALVLGSQVGTNSRSTTAVNAGWDHVRWWWPPLCSRPWWGSGVAQSPYMGTGGGGTVTIHLGGCYLHYTFFFLFKVKV